MGKFEKLLTATDPLLTLRFGTVPADASNVFYGIMYDVRFDPARDMFVISCSPFPANRSGIGEIILYSDLNENYQIFFGIFRWISFKFIKNLKEEPTSQQKIYHSAGDVFQSLNLPGLTDNLPAHPLESLKIQCARIRENWPALHIAFSEDHISATYDALSRSRGYSEEMIHGMMGEQQ